MGEVELPLLLQLDFHKAGPCHKVNLSVVCGLWSVVCGLSADISQFQAL